MKKPFIPSLSQISQIALLSLLVVACGDDSATTPEGEESSSSVADSLSSSSSIADTTAISSSSEEPSSSSAIVQSQNDLWARLGPGINMGNGMEADPDEGSWGFVVEDQWIDSVASAGFGHIRVPVRWQTHVGGDFTNCPVEKAWMDRVTHVVDYALAKDLGVMLDVHHFNELYENPDDYKPCFLSLWSQIARNFADRDSNKLFLEVLNEPRDVIDAQWPAMFAEAVDTIRAHAPSHTIVFTGGNWGHMAGLRTMQIPEDDNLAATFHFYDPFDFTHQGADWAGENPIGVTWFATLRQKQAISLVLDEAAAFAQSTGIPIYLGEFGAYSAGDMLSRSLWTEFVSTQATARKIPWAYWEFGSGFGIFDPDNMVWRDSLKNALVNPSVDFDTFVFDTIHPPLESLEAVKLGDFDTYTDTQADINQISGAATTANSLPLDSAPGRWYIYHNEESHMTNAQGDTIATGEGSGLKLVAGAGKTGKGIELNMHLTGTSYPYVGFGTSINGNEVWTDQTKLKAITFWARGEGEMYLRLDGKLSRIDCCADDNWGQWVYQFYLTDKWIKYVVWTDELVPTPYSTLAGMELGWSEGMTEIDNLTFQNGQSYGMEVDEMIKIQVDDVTFHYEK